MLRHHWDITVAAFWLIQASEPFQIYVKSTETETNFECHQARGNDRDIYKMSRYLGFLSYVVILKCVSFKHFKLLFR